MASKMDFTVRKVGAISNSQLPPYHLHILSIKQYSLPESVLQSHKSDQGKVKRQFWQWHQCN
jgi:hypothetical protein